MKDRNGRAIAAASILLIGVISIVASSRPTEPTLVLEPENYCATSKIHVEWNNAPGGTEISADPAIFSTFKANPSSGALDQPINLSNLPNTPPYKVKISMAYTVDNKSSKLTKDVQIMPPGATEKLHIAFTPDCTKGDPPTWAENILPDMWDPSLTIKSVGNMSGRNIKIGHYSSPNIDIPKGGFSNALNGQSPSGNWSAWAKLKEADLGAYGSTGTYEACNPITGTTGIGQGAVQEQPPQLKIIVTYGC